MAKFYKPINNKQIVFPVGAIYLSIQEDNPSKYFGGTWEQIKGRFLVGCGSNGVDLYTDAGQTGGEATHILTVSEMPKHNHDITHRGFFNTDNYSSITNRPCVSFITFPQDEGAEFTCSEVGGNSAHNNLPPYLAVYMWKRIA